MCNLKRLLSVLSAFTLAFSLSACGFSDSDSAKSDPSYKEKDDFQTNLSPAEEYISNDPSINNVKGKTIYWLSYYDINPSNNQDRSVALSLFEDKYGGKVEYVPCSSDNKFDVLAARLLADDPVDMFPYEWDAVPNGVVKDQYLPLDDYIDFDEPLWSDMKDIIDMYEFDGSHYVVPYSMSDPLLITYSRSLCRENNLPDPYELYKKGEWNWDSFMDMMNSFTSSASDGEIRFGVNGWLGQALIVSTGDCVVNYSDGVFSNNIKSADIESAENLMEEMMRKKLYDPSWQSCLPDDGNTLFYAMSEWSLGESNMKNDSEPEFDENGSVQSNDIMVVPFPKAPFTDKYYLSCNFGAKMLVKNSRNGDAVAAYIKCERLAATTEEYRSIERDKKLIPEKNAAGVLKNYITAEQYDAIAEYRNPSLFTPVFDFGYGMGERMFSDGEYTYETRGIMDNITSAVLNGDKDSWAVVRDEWGPVIDRILSEYNNR